MATEIKMPQLGESVTEGTVGRWLKQPGEPVAKYEALLEVITDKVDSEVPAPVAGTLLEILVAEGETVRVGTVIARVGASDEAATAAPPTSQPAATPALVPPMAAATPRDGTGPQGGGTFLSPVVARLLAEHGLEQAEISGSGQGGRVTKQDVLRLIAARAAAPSAAGSQPAASTTERAAASPQPPDRPVEYADASPPPAALPADSELVPLSPMRRAIAEHMERSVRTAPHVTTVIEVDLQQVTAHRVASQATFARQGVRLTYTAYFVQAVAEALGRVPVLNGSFSSDGIVLNRRTHIGVAVGLAEGLIVPVVRDADEKSLLGLARTIGDLSERARARRLRPEETQGGTFTITNHGVTGSLFATPIINQPQAAILGVGAIVKRPVVVSQGSEDAIAIRPICYLSLTFDHRITDGAMADGFLAIVREALEGYAEA